MTTIDTSTPTQDECMMASLSHAAIILPVIGIVVPIIFWVTQKEKSKYVAFQCFQALIFHICMILVWNFEGVCFVISFLCTTVILPMASYYHVFGNVDPIIDLSIIPLIIIILTIVGQLFFLIYGIIGAIMTFRGEPFRYLFIGKRIEKRRDQSKASNG